jgi:ferredoxin
MDLDPAKINPRHLKISFRRSGEEISRRDLLFGLIRPQYEVVPAVEEERCGAWRGCSLCIASCPAEAISLKEESAFIDKDKCTACGACLPSCPEEAITSPLLNPEVLDDLLQPLLWRGEGDPRPKVLVISSEDSDTLHETTTEPLSPELLELRLPCIGAFSPWLLLRSFDLGADGVIVIPCGSTCRHRCQPDRWQRTIRFVQALLVKLGIEPERLKVFSFSREEPQSLTDLSRAFVEEVKRIGSTGLRNGNGQEKHLTPLALLKDLSRRFRVDGSLCGNDIPFGIVTATTGDRTCTLCGACPERCPTGAITLREGTDLSQLLFDHSRCIACEACVQVCPEQVLQMEGALDFSRLGETTILAEDRMARCRECGKPIAPLNMIRRMQDQMATGKVSAWSGLSELCPDCRIFGRLA